MSAFSTNHFLCPICGSKLFRGIVFDDRDNMIITCGNCGTYGLTATYYEDEIESAKGNNNLEHIKSFLQRHKSDLKRPFISHNPAVAPEGFKNYTWSHLDQ